MFRVSQTKDSAGTVVNIDGQLIGDYVRLTEDCCSQALSGGTPVRLFLRDVSFIDAAGRMLLQRLAERGVRLLASGVYTSDIVRSIQGGRTAASANGQTRKRRNHT